MFKKLGVLFIIFIMIFTLAACGTGQDKKPQDEDPGNGDVIVDPDPQGEEVEVTIYYMNTEYILTGDSSLERLIPVIRTVTVGKESIEEAIVAELQKTPEEEELTTALDEINVLSIEKQDNIAYINLSSEGLNGGSLQESSILSQVVWTLTELPDIEKVQFLVDGSKRESLMGHIIIEEPLGREE